MNIDIEDLTIKQARELAGIFGESKKQELPFKIGDKVFIRTVTYASVGRIKSIIGKFLVLENGSWVADSGRFHVALKDGILNEVEFYSVDAIINTDSIVDCFEWRHALPTESK